MAHGSTPNENFLERLQDIPVVNDTLVKAGAIYSGTKSYSLVLRLSLETAESGLGIFFNTTMTVVKAFDKPIGTINNLACAKLEKLERDYPIIVQPTEEILKQTKSTIQPIVERLKPLTDRVICLTKYSVEKITIVKDYTVERVEPVVKYGLNKVDIVRSYATDKITVVYDATARRVSIIVGQRINKELLARVETLTRTYFGFPRSEAGIEVTDSDKTPISGLWGTVALVYDHATKTLQAIRAEPTKALSTMTPANLMANANYLYYGIKDRVLYVWLACNDPQVHVQNTLTVYEVQLVVVGRDMVVKAINGKRILQSWIRGAAATLDPIIPEFIKEAFPDPMKSMLIQSPHKSRSNPVTLELTSTGTGEAKSSSTEESKGEEKKEDDVYHSPLKGSPERHHE